MSETEVPQWRDGERRTVKDLLSQQEGARGRAKSVACPKMSKICDLNDRLAGCKERIEEAQVRIASAGCAAMYDVTNADVTSNALERASKDFGESMRRSLEMDAPTPDDQLLTRLPFIECRLRKSSTPGAAPVGFVEHYTYIKEKNKKSVDEGYEKDLYVFWRGSQDFMDWACDANASLAPSQDGDVMIHGGMYARFAEFKDDIENEMLNFVNDDKPKYGDEVQPRRIYFAGHSLGAGLAMLTHFQLYAAEKDHHWPSSTRIRDFAKDPSNGVFMIGFAGPPVFHVKAPTESVKQVSGRGVNFAMEYDIVPRMMNVQYCKDVLRSCVEGTIDAETDSPLIKVFVGAVMKKPLSKLEELLENNAELMRSLQHLHPMFLQYIDKTENTWQWTVLDHGSSDAADAYSNFVWPYKSESPMSTLMPVNDHTVFPGKLDKTWRDDVCSVCGEVPENEEEKWKDCLHCQTTFCAQCFEKEHKDPPRGVIVEWHAQEERSLDDKKSWRVAFKMAGIKAARFLNDMRYNTMLIRMAADVFKPTNIWLAADLLRDTGKIGQLAAQIGQAAGQAGSSFALAGQAVSKVVGPAECIFVGAMAVCETGWLIYKRWSCNELDCSQFWMKLSVCWASAAGTIGGLFAGAWMGGLVGSLFGPIGTVVGALIGSAVGGAIGGAATRYASEELIKWAAGLDPEAKEKVDWGIICRAMHVMDFGTQTKPSALTAQETRSALRRQALIHHPDKTGLMGKKGLTKEEEETLKASSIKFHHIQNHFDTLSAFIDARDQEGSVWTPGVLSRLDRFYIQLLDKFEKIDEEAERKKEEAAKGTATSKGGYIDN